MLISVDAPIVLVTINLVGVRVDVVPIIPVDPLKIPKPSQILTIMLQKWIKVSLRMFLWREMQAIRQRANARRQMKDWPMVAVWSFA